MDNAQKAIMIGVGLFITLIIISAVLLVVTTGTNMINSAEEQLSGITSLLQTQVTAKYDGKVVSGSEVINACTLYENDQNLSVWVVVGSNNFHTGKYDVKLADGETMPTTAKAGGVEVAPTGDGVFKELSGDAKASLAKIQDIGGVVGTQSYNSYLMKYNDTVMGILFVKK